jgi:hypothetical protein
LHSRRRVCWREFSDDFFAIDLCDMRAIPRGYLALVLASALFATVTAVQAQNILSKESAARELRAGR